MIFKFFELKNKKLGNYNYFLLYGNNSGLIEETINNQIKTVKTNNIFNYDEDEIIKNPNTFEENILNSSFFENEKLIIISRASDKILKIIEPMIEKNIEDLTIIIKTNILEKKSKLRTFFEKNSNTICIPFYEDNSQTLAAIVQKFLMKKNIKMSTQNINILVERSNGNRINLYNELNKIDSFSKNKKVINTNDILKLTNLSENFSVYELVDNSLARKQKKTLNILNENNFSQEDCVLILRIYLTKLKRLLKIQKEVLKEKNVDKAISSYKPPIFWKEKDVVKEQIRLLKLNKLHELIVKVNEIELLIKKYPSAALNVTTDFILDQAQ
tara:strand:- start:166 stop:1149 length:984 start_codon:yes stop_codon:yes gene_type:complete